MHRPTLTPRLASVTTALAMAAVLAACNSGAASNPSTVAGPAVTTADASGLSPTVPGTGVETTTTPVDSETTTSPAVPEASTTAVAAAAADAQPITVAFGGDVHGEPPIDGVLAKGGNPLQFVSPLLQQADIAAVNLETTVGDAGSAQVKKFVFRARPTLLTMVKAAGVDVVSTANNHSYDFGRDGLQATLDQISKAGLIEAGSGNNSAEAYAPAIIDVRGTKVAIVGIAKVGPSDSGRATATRPGTTNGKDTAATLAAITAAKAQAPIVIVFIHWGIELDTCPQAADRGLAQAMLDAGASAVIGAHPHVLQGISTPPGKLVAYSVGNFVFYAKRPIARQTGVLTVSFSPDGRVLGHSFDPARIDTSGRPVPLTGAERTKAIDALEALAPDKGGCG